MPCDSPYYVENKDFPKRSKKRFVPVPCGKCPPCKRRRVNAWVFRMLQEEKRSSCSYFVTFTYDTRDVPITPKGYMSLRYKDFQDFFKRLRKNCSFARFRYYVAGEYGENYFRPHYHALIFVFADSFDVSQFARCWGHGDVVIGSVSGASIAYTCKYIDKQKKIPMHENDDRVREFSRMSKNLGANYITPAIEAFHKASLENNFVTALGGQKLPLPRYYRFKIYSEDERVQQGRIVAKLQLKKLIFDEREYLRMYPLSDFMAFDEEKKRYRYQIFYSRISKKRNKL